MATTERSGAARQIIEKARAANPSIVEEADFTVGPGRFEGQADPYLTYVLHAVALDSSWLNEQAGGDQDTDWAGRIESFVLTQDAQGFCGVDEYPTAAEAQRAFADLQSEIEGPEADLDDPGLAG